MPPRGREISTRGRAAYHVGFEISDDRRPELLIGNSIRYALNPAQREHGVRLQTAYHDAVRDTIAEGVQAGVTQRSFRRQYAAGRMLARRANAIA